MDSISGVGSDKKLSGLSSQSQAQGANSTQGVDSTSEANDPKKAGASQVASATFGSKDI